MKGPGDETALAEAAEKPPRSAADPRMIERRRDVARAKARRRRRVFLASSAVAFLAIFGLVLIHSPVFGASDVVVSGSLHTSRSAVLSAAQLNGSPPLVDLSSASIARRVEELPYVKKAVVTLSWPSTVRIRIVERTPVAALTANGRRFALVDDTGRVLEVSATVPAGLPEITASGGVPPPGKWLSRSRRELALVAATMPESLVSRVQEVRDTRLGVACDLKGGIVALFGPPTSLRAKFVSLATVLAEGSLSGVALIDLRDPANPVLAPSLSVIDR
jgi:cell division protein FtsQ